jgi:membrane fusion protein (multidrug efflux system)
VSRNPRGEATVLVVGADNKVVERVVTTDHVINNEWLVTQGLVAGERVIVDGLQKAKPGQVVRTVEASAPSDVASR